MKVYTDNETIERILTKAVEQILPSKQFLEQKLRSRQRLNVYQGFDPTADTLHIGHTVGMRKLEDFRKLGHHVIFLIGDFTARIGDPSDKATARKVLSEEQVKQNLKNYVEQASHIIDMNNKENPVDILFNSTWHEKLTFKEVIQLSTEFTVQQMLKRSMFQQRIKEDRPIYLNEFLYPIMQGYDSVMMNIDVEIGGNDQLFNMLAGRDMVLNHLQKEKIVLATRLLTTPDGTKMGKSEGNMIKLSDRPEEIYGKVMASPDDMLIQMFELLTSATSDEVDEYKKRLENEENPMNLKKELAFRITKEVKTEKEAQQAQKHFETVFQTKKADTDTIEKKIIDQKEIPILDLLMNIGFTNSKAQGRRLIEQGAVKINNKKCSDYKTIIDLTNTPETILKAGRHICSIRYGR
ncbi:MAG TPA: tyrosine--tRNA ligase [Candidatus Dojkabacteria bacterium]|nr:tyrosine--tRNA ligase [Candidatus Dojkabacteria bacterium]